MRQIKYYNGNEMIRVGKERIDNCDEFGGRLGVSGHSSFTRDKAGKRF